MAVRPPSNSATDGAVANKIATGQVTLTTSPVEITAARNGANSSNVGIRNNIIISNNSKDQTATRTLGVQITEGATAPTTGDGKVYILISPSLNNFQITSAEIASVTNASSLISVQIAKIRSGVATDMLQHKAVIQSGASTGIAGVPI